MMYSSSKADWETAENRDLLAFSNDFISSRCDFEGFWMLIDKSINVSDAFLFENLIDRNKDTCFLDIAKTIVDGSTEHLHGWTQSHISIHQWRNIIA